MDSKAGCKTAHFEQRLEGLHPDFVGMRPDQSLKVSLMKVPVLKRGRARQDQGLLLATGERLFQRIVAEVLGYQVPYAICA